MFEQSGRLFVPNWRTNSWYKNAAGNVTQNWPFTLLEYWERTRQAEPADYGFIGDPTLAAPRLSTRTIPSIA